MADADARSVVLYVDDGSVACDASERCEAVSCDDIAEWLSLLGDLDGQVRLQYDAAAHTTCFRVRFRRDTVAQQAVANLNGTRLRGALVRIVPAQGNAAHAAPVATAANKDALTGAGACVASASPPTPPHPLLPHNSTLTADLQMSGPLLDYLEMLSCDADAMASTRALHTLQSLQAEWARVHAEAASCARALQDTDAKLTALLQYAPQANRGVAHSTRAPAHSTRAQDCAAGTATERMPADEAAPRFGDRACFTNAASIPVSLCTPAAAVGLVTTTHGPVARCACALVSQRATTLTDDAAYQLQGLSFVFAADARGFASRVGNDAGDGGEEARGHAGHAGKRGRSASEADVLAHALFAPQYMWTPATQTAATRHRHTAVDAALVDQIARALR